MFLLECRAPSPRVYAGTKYIGFLHKHSFHPILEKFVFTHLSCIKLQAMQSQSVHMLGMQNNYACVMATATKRAQATAGSAVLYATTTFDTTLDNIGARRCAPSGRSMAYRRDVLQSPVYGHNENIHVFTHSCETGKRFVVQSACIRSQQSHLLAVIWIESCIYSAEWIVIPDAAAHTQSSLN